jgi:hypothetical protein
MVWVPLSHPYHHRYLTVTNYLVVQGLLMCCADWVVGTEIGGLSGGHSVLLGMH